MQNEYKLKLSNKYEALGKLFDEDATTEQRWKNIKNMLTSTREETVD